MLLMDEKPDPPGSSHFSLPAIQAAEKSESRRQRKRRLRKKQDGEEAELKQEEFKVSMAVNASECTYIYMVNAGGMVGRSDKVTISTNLLMVIK